MKKLREKSQLLPGERDTAEEDETECQKLFCFWIKKTKQRQIEKRESEQQKNVQYEQKETKRPQ